MLSMWLECRTQQEIGDAVGVDDDTVSVFLQKIRKIDGYQKSEKSAILHEDFEPQIYSVWNFPKATNEVRHFGNIPPEIIDNLLYYYTKPFDVVFDPFGGGGPATHIAIAATLWQRQRIGRVQDGLRVIRAVACVLAQACGPPWQWTAERDGC